MKPREIINPGETQGARLDKILLQLSKFCYHGEEKV